MKVELILKSRVICEVTVQFSHLWAVLHEFVLELIPFLNLNSVISVHCF